MKKAQFVAFPPIPKFNLLKCFFCPHDISANYISMPFVNGYLAVIKISLGHFDKTFSYHYDIKLYKATLIWVSIVQWKLRLRER